MSELRKTLEIQRLEEETFGIEAFSRLFTGVLGMEYPGIRWSFYERAGLSCSIRSVELHFRYEYD